VIAELDLLKARGDVDVFRASGAMTLQFDTLRLSARYTGGRATDGAAFTLGGTQSSILPDGAVVDTFFDPAVPFESIHGDRYDGRRFEISTRALPVTLFWNQHRLWSVADGQRRRMRVVGLEAAFGSDAQPLLQLPGFSITAGVARLMDEPLRDDTSLWLALRWRP
jgi:hypothetical protein